MRIPKGWIGALIILSFVGFLDATYLTAKHYIGLELNCILFKGCEQVTTSAYAMVGGVPVALLGALYYLTVFLLFILYLDTKREIFLRIATLFTPLGFLVSLWFLYLQIFVIKALCLYCLVSLATSTLLFIISMVLIHKYSFNTHE